MGLFNFLNKSKDAVSITNSEESGYSPWNENNENSNTDYSNAVFLWWLSFGAKPLYSESDSYPRYLSYELGISNPKKKHLEFLQEGYLVNADINDVLSTLKLDELKTILNKYNLPSKGKKAELVAKILSSIN